MYLLAILRFILDLVSGIGAAAPRAGAFEKRANTVRRSRAPGRRAALPHEWMSMANVLTEVSRSVAWRDRRSLGGSNHPLHFVFRLVRRWAGIAELCPAPAARVSSTNWQSRRS